MPEENIPQSIEEGKSNNDIIEKFEEADKSTPFFSIPRFLDKYTVAKIKVKETLESISKWAAFYVRKFEQRYGLYIEFALSLRYNEYGMPCLIIEILNIKFPEDLVEEKAEKEESKE